MIKAVAAVSALCCLAGGGALAQLANAGTMRPLAAVPFMADADVPCLRSALQTGNPGAGASTWALKAPAGCVVPWHRHTAREQLIVVTGDVQAEMVGHQPTRLGPGGFAVMEGGMAHQFTCQGREACVMFITFDQAYDIQWGKGGP
jgi:quercetin dioxygenase-like cupin family protein